MKASGSPPPFSSKMHPSKSPAKAETDPGVHPNSTTGQSDADKRSGAVALGYAPGDSAPRVLAKGYGTVAQNIIRTAREHGLYVHESPELVSVLMQLDLDAHIPPALYEAIAEILAWLYRLEEEMANDQTAMPATS